MLDEAGETAEYNRLLASIVAENKNQRFDLVASVAAEKVFVHIENEQVGGGPRHLSRRRAAIGPHRGSHLFYQLVQPYVQSCLEEGKTAYAVEAMERVGNSFEPQKGSILDADLRELAGIVNAKAKQ